MTEPKAHVPWMGAFHGKWHINLHISPTTCSFCSVVFAMILIHFKDFKPLKFTEFGALAGQIQPAKVGITPWLLRQVAITCRFQAQLH
jgi:hypothetical protein